MFQSFDLAVDPASVAPRLAGLRARMDALGLDIFLLPRADAHQSEFLPPDQERLAWLTGFSGSAGYAAVLKDGATLFVDGRYTIQAEAQTDTGLFEIVHLVDVGPLTFLEDRLTGGEHIGVDPWLHTRAGMTKLRKLAERKGCDLVMLDSNPIDALWEDRPAPPDAPVARHPLDHAGRSAQDKLEEMQEALRDKEVDAFVITQPENIAWLFNIRGGDVAHMPIALGFAILPASGRPQLFLAPEKLSPDVTAYLADSADLLAPDGFPDALGALGTAKVGIEFAMTAERIAEALDSAGATLVDMADPCTLAKAKKTAAEIAGARTAHLRDGAAVARFLAWFDAESPTGGLDEIAATTKLEDCRRATNRLKDISFDTISGAGPHGAIVHYRVSHDTNRKIEANSLFLIDSGGQYNDGTTDITRTLAVGTPDEAMRRAFTLVLKGMIAISLARFPKGTTGAQLDALARIALWQAGFDYDHGTGHGVGSYLGVHEGPQRISKTGTVALEPGMILSNEPGYYREGAFGIRIENLVLVTEAEPIAGGDKEMLGFETLTFAPIDRRLVVPGLLGEAERAWLNDYHAAVFARLGPEVDDQTRAWLEQACAPV